MEPKTELQKNAIVNARRKELETYQRALDIQWLNNRMEDGRMGRCLALIQKETEMEKAFKERTDHAAIVNARAEKEIALGIEIAKKDREESCQLLRRHYLRERDPELRDLTRKLQAAYIRRDLEQQILHNEYKKLQDKTEEANANRILQNALFDDNGVEEKEGKNKMERQRQYRLELQQQMLDKQQQKQCKREDTLMEKKMLDEIIRTIADEDQREKQQKLEQTEKMHREMEEFKKAREERKEKEKQMVVLEEKKIENAKNAALDRNLAVVKERERKFRLKEEANQKIAAKILAEQAAREERENIIKQLQEQELLENNAQHDLREREQRERWKRERERERAAQRGAGGRGARGERERESDRSYRQHMEAKIAAEEEKEKERVKLKREQARQYGLELKKQMEENETRRRAEREREETRAAHVRRYRENWNVEVSAERQHLLREHAPPGTSAATVGGGGDLNETEHL